MVLKSVSFADANNGTTVGLVGRILHTTNGGTNWTVQIETNSIDLCGVHFTDVNNGTVVGDIGTILRTTDAGINWTYQSSGTTKIYGA